MSLGRGCALVPTMTIIVSSMDCQKQRLAGAKVVRSNSYQKQEFSDAGDVSSTRVHYLELSFTHVRVEYFYPCMNF